MNKTTPSKNPGGDRVNKLAPPANPPPAGSSALPTASNGYVPKYKPPAEPTAIPTPNVENHIELPTSIDVVTLEDVCRRIYDNASVLAPGQRTKLTTARAPSGLLYHALILVPRNPEREASRWRVEIRGPGVGVRKSEEAKGRREALEALLGDLERKIGKEMLGG